MKRYPEKRLYRIATEYKCVGNSNRSCKGGFVYDYYDLRGLYMHTSDFRFKKFYQMPLIDNMKKNAQVFFFLLGISFLYSCSTINSTVLLNNKEVRLMNLDTVKKVNSIPLSDIFSSVKVIVLDDKEALIGWINRICLYKNKLFILDSSTAKGIFEFDQEGAFIRKIGNIGSGPGEYATCDDVAINEQMQEIYAYDSRFKRINTYDVHTEKYKGVINLEKWKNIDRIWVNSGHLYVVNCGLSPNQTNPYYILKEVDIESGDEIGAWLRSDQYNKGWMDSFFSYNLFYPINKSTDLFAYGLGDSIMSLNNGKLSPYIALSGKKIIKENEITKENTTDLKDAYSNSKRNIDLFLQWGKQGKIVDISNIFQSKQMLYMNCTEQYSYTLQYDMTNGKTQTFSTKDDLLFSEMPKSYVVPSFLTCDENGVYYLVRTDNLPELKEFAFGNLISDKVFNKERLKKLDDDSNPVILYYEFKK